MKRNVFYDTKRKAPQLIRPRHEIIKSMDREPQVYNLDNGAKIITKERKGRDVGIFLGFPFGLSHDLHGSHLSEHLFFRRGDKELGIEVHEAIERIGGYFTGYTTEDLMGFPIFLAADRLEEATTILSACLKQRKVEKKHLKLEQSVVCGELDQRWSEPEAYLGVAEQKILFPNGHPLDLERETKKAYHRLTTDDIELINRTKFGTKNLHVGLVGPDIPKLLECTKRLLDNLLYEGNSIPKFSYSELLGNKKTVRRPGVKDISTYLSFLIEGNETPDLPALELMFHILEGNGAQDYMISSRLFRSLRTETGVMYHTASNIDHFNGVGYATFGCSGTQSKNADRVERILLKEMQRLREELVPEAEYDCALRSFSLSASRTVRYEVAPEEIAEDLVLGEFYKTPRTQREYVRQVKSVTPEEIRRVANKYASPDKVLVSILRGQ